MRFDIGDTVRFTGCSDAQVEWGNNNDPRGILVVDAEYIVSYVGEHDWYTKIELEGIKGSFNSVCFEVVE